MSAGDLHERRAHWVSVDTLVWPGHDDPALRYELHGASTGGLALTPSGVTGGVRHRLIPSGRHPDGVDGRLHLAGLPAFTLGGDLDAVPTLLRGQLAVVALDGGRVVDATGVQIPGVVDDLYATDAPLGVVWSADVPSLHLWAPTARSVTLHLFDDSTTSAGALVPMSETDGVWSVVGDPAWAHRYYLYEVEVFVPATGRVEHNLVTDPYSVSLSTNSTRTQIVDLTDPALAPDGWDGETPPPLADDLSIYELHVRDFSIADLSVSPADRGTFAAFTHADSAGMRHLGALAEAGLTHVHLLPVFDFATVDDHPAHRREPDPTALAAAAPDSELQQRAVAATRHVDGFNWGYDPLHWSTPDGSYSTDPDGPQRIVELRAMVRALHRVGLRVVLDVVYNHTHRSGQDPRSVLDRIVPGYHHRLDETGEVTTSTCCANTATEHRMTARLMIDSVVTWARNHHVDGFRFDLMGHHSRRNMVDVRAALDALRPDEDGVDGRQVYLYGEGWNFGEVADHARFEQATRARLRGTGIGTFDDGLRDAVRGGGPFDTGVPLVAHQGYVNGLFHDPNDLAAGTATPAAALGRLRVAEQRIRLGLTGGGVDPREHVVYVEAHDNQTLFDIGQYKHPLDATTSDRVRAQILATAIVVLAQGVPFLHAGQDLLRSKSMDRDSYDSGDWFNRLDLTGESSNWGVGLPPAWSNEADWPLIRPRLASLPAPSCDDIELAAATTREWFRIRSSSPLLRLPTASEVGARVSFGNTGPDSIPGLVVMTIRDDLDDRPGIDHRWRRLHVLLNATSRSTRCTDLAWSGRSIALHPVLVDSVDPVVRRSGADVERGGIVVPARTAAVFVEPRR